MRLLKCGVSNFASYKHLEFDFSNQGLALIYGATGSGKSTLCDISAWILFGITTKDGNADEVKSWQTPGEVTEGQIEVETNDGTKILVYRSRGKAARNDLYWRDLSSADSEPRPHVRGKDLTETQKLLNQRLGVDPTLYLSSSNLSEFSPTATFFVDNAKKRREVFEKIANLDLPKKLAERTSDAKKETKKDLQEKEIAYARLEGHCSSLGERRNHLESERDNYEITKREHFIRLRELSSNFEVEKKSKIDAAQTKADNFETQRNKTIDILIDKIERLGDVPALAYLQAKLEKLKLEQPSESADLCPTCRAPRGSELKAAYLKQLNRQERELEIAGDRLAKRQDLAERLREAQESPNTYLEQVEAAKQLKNHYIEQLKVEKSKINPYENQLLKIEAALQTASKEKDSLQATLDEAKRRITALTQLYDLSSALRAELLHKAIKEIEENVNTYLESYFHNELRVEFVMKDNDNLEVSIKKGGYECTFRQLSKGQRSLLRLSFGVAVMEASANQAGTNFNLVTMDEPTDGLDAELKVKAYRLFESIATRHESVLVVEHSTELKEMFDKRYKVELINDYSHIEAEA
jgi:DNA repair exonuclease SbcCD ATPase subunit